MAAVVVFPCEEMGMGEPRLAKLRVPGGRGDASVGRAPVMAELDQRWGRQRGRVGVIERRRGRKRRGAEP